MAHLHSVFDSDSHFVINPVTRAIKNVSSPKATVIQHDHNSERFTFEVPRMVEQHDMLLCNRAEVHYINIDSRTNEQATGIYIMDDLRVDPDDADNVICSWLVSRNATQYAGSLYFIVSFICDVNNEEVYRWNTAVFSGISVSVGIQNDAEEIITPYVDIIEQWRTSIFGAGDGVLASIQEEGEAQIQAVQAAGENITNACEIAKSEVKSVLANAIVGKQSGEIIAVDDVSPVEHTVKVKVQSKNMCILSGAGQSNGLTYSCNNGVWNITGIPTKTYAGITSADITEMLEDGEIYTISQSQYFNSTVAAGVMYLQVSIDDYENNKSYVLSALEPKTFIIDKARYKNYTIMLQTGGSLEEINLNNFTMQIEKGDTATAFTPYVDPETITLIRCGKNFFNGIWETGSINADGTEGTATNRKRTGFINVLPNTTYQYSTNDEYSRVNVFEYNSNKEFIRVNSISTGNIITSENTRYIRLYNELSNYADYWYQLEENSTVTEYEAYKGASYTPDANGVVNAASLSPNMTILTDTAGANIDCEYIIDTKTYIDRKIAEMMEGGV